MPMRDHGKWLMGSSLSSGKENESGKERRGGDGMTDGADMDEDVNMGGRVVSKKRLCAMGTATTTSDDGAARSPRTGRRCGGRVGGVGVCVRVAVGLVIVGVMVVGARAASEGA